MTYTGLLNVKDISSSIVKPKFGIFNPDSSYSKRRIDKSGIWGLKDVYEQQKNQSWLFSNKNIRIKNQILSSSPVYNSVSAEKCASNIKLSNDTFCLVYASSNTQVEYKIFTIGKGLSLADGGLISSRELGSIVTLSEPAARVSEISSSFDEVSGRILLSVTYGYGIGGGIAGGSQIMTSKSAVKIIIGKYNSTSKSISWTAVDNLYDLVISTSPYNNDPVPTNTSPTTLVNTPVNTATSTSYVTSSNTFYSTPTLTAYATTISTAYSTLISTVIGYDSVSTKITTTGPVQALTGSIYYGYTRIRTYNGIYPTFITTLIDDRYYTTVPGDVGTFINTQGAAILGFTPGFTSVSTSGFTYYATVGLTPVATAISTIYSTTISTPISTSYVTSVVTLGPGDPIISNAPPSQIYSVCEIKNIGENKFIISTHGYLRVVTLTSDIAYSVGTEIASSIVPTGGSTELLKTAWDSVSDEYIELAWDIVNSQSKISRYSVSGTTITQEDTSIVSSTQVSNSIGNLINIGERKYIWNDYDKVYQITHNGTTFTISASPLSLGSIGTGNYNTALVKDSSIDGFIVGYFSNETTSSYNKIVNYKYENAISGGVEENNFELLGTNLSNNSAVNYVDIVPFEDNVFLLIYEYSSALYANVLVLRTY